MVEYNSWLKAVFPLIGGFELEALYFMLIKVTKAGDCFLIANISSRNCGISWMMVSRMMLVSIL